MTTLQLIPYLTTEAAEVAAFGAKALRTIETVGLIGGEVFTAGAILWTLNAAGTAIEKTYNAGKVVGRVYFNHVKPVVDLIDWREVASMLWQFALVAGTAFYVAGEATRKAYSTWHANWVGSIDWTIPADAEDPRDTAAAEVRVPEVEVEETIDYNQFKVVELRRMAKGLASGLHKMRKAELVALLAA